MSFQYVHWNSHVKKALHTFIKDLTAVDDKSSYNTFSLRLLDMTGGSAFQMKNEKFLNVIITNSKMY